MISVFQADPYYQEQRSEKLVLAEALSELHNSGDIDFVKIVKEIDKSSCKNFFTILHIFEITLPLLKSKVEDVISCLVHLTQKNFAGRLYGAFQHFCQVDA